MFTVLPTSVLSDNKAAVSPVRHATLTLTPEGLFGIMPCSASGDRVYWFYSREVPIALGR